MNKNELITAFDNLSISEKRKEIGRELSETMLLIYEYVKQISNIEGEMNLDDFLNLYDSKLNEDQYLTFFYEDFLNFKELLAIYLSKTNVD